MSNLQRIILLAGVLIAAGVVLRPPYRWEQTTYLINPNSNVPHRTPAQIVLAGHHWIWAPPQGWRAVDDPGWRETTHVAKIDWERTGVYAGLPIVLFAFAAFAVRGQKKREG